MELSHLLLERGQLSFPQRAGELSKLEKHFLTESLPFLLLPSGSLFPNLTDVRRC